MTGPIHGTTVFAFGAGVATFFSPCVYALLPGYVSYYVASVDSEAAPLSGAVSRGIAASVGALGTFAVLSAIALAAGEALERALPLLEYMVGGLLILFGVLVVYKGTLSFSVVLPERQESIVGFGIFGAAYALAATACVLPLFLSISVVSFELSIGGALVVLGAYAGSFAALMLAATITTAIGKQALLSRFAGHAGTMTKVAGVVLVVAGVIQLAIAAGIDVLP
jgi:cytochrome c-type biogenesis protein